MWLAAEVAVLVLGGAFGWAYSTGRGNAGRAGPTKSAAAGGWVRASVGVGCLCLCPVRTLAGWATRCAVHTAGCNTCAEGWLRGCRLLREQVARVAQGGQRAQHDS